MCGTSLESLCPCRQFPSPESPAAAHTLGSKAGVTVCVLFDICANLGVTHVSGLQERAQTLYLEPILTLKICRKQSHSLAVKQETIGSVAGSSVLRDFKDATEPCFKLLSIGWRGPGG